MLDPPFNFAVYGLSKIDPTAEEKELAMVKIIRRKGIV